MESSNRRGESLRPLLNRMQSKTETFHQQIPGLRKLPGPALAIVLFIASINVLVWVACGVVLAYHRSLIATAALSYSLGLRHALDADHIAAIDLMTRRLMATGQRPVTVGTYFSLGHSTVVIITSIVVAASSAAISDRFDGFGKIGGIIGSSVSSVFLLILGAMNAYILYRLYTQLQKAIASPIGQETLDFDFNAPGCMLGFLKKMFAFVDRPWKMYPLGFLFGLGFDTSSEIALLGISSIQASQGTSIWLILIFPVLFTAGMCLLDTFDGAAMMSLYSSARLAKDAIAVLYYQCVLTSITVVVAIVIGVLQLLNMISSIRPDLGGPFWDGVGVAGDHYDVIGGSIVASFLVFGVASVVLYKPWRRRIDRKRVAAAARDEGPEEQDEHDELESVQADVEGATERTALQSNTHGAVEVVEGEPERTSENRKGKVSSTVHVVGNSSSRK